MRKVAVVDYGMGNLLSVERAIARCGSDPVRVATPSGLETAEVVVLPGVGAFADGMAGLRDRGFVEPLRAHAASGRPLLAICLGMHMLFERSSEFGSHEGLGIVPGTVEAVPAVGVDGQPLKSPHIGWSPLRCAEAGASGSELADVLEDEWFYFVHSFAAIPSDDATRVADTEYGGYRVSSVVAMDRIVGTQFHPEKSGPAGLRLIARLLDLYA